MLTILGVVCILGTLGLYILGMVLGSNALFGCAIACGVVGMVVGKKAEAGSVSMIFVACLLLSIASGLELFMRVRDGFTGKGMYYIHLLRHPEDNKWY